MTWFMGTWLLLIVPLIWSLYCNEATYRQRKKLRVPWQTVDHDMFLQLVNEYEEVSYNKHFFNLLTFQNPMKLYGLLTQKVSQTRGY